MFNAFIGTPIACFFGHKFTVIRNENLQCFARLDCDGLVPDLERRDSIGFCARENRPNITRKVINNIHGIQVPGAGSYGHWSTQVNVYSP